MSVESGYYSDDVESVFAKEIEAPAASVIRKIISKEVIGNHERRALASYIVNLIKRGPDGKALMKKLLPEGKEEIGLVIDSQIEALKDNNPSRADDLIKVRREVMNLDALTPDIWNSALLRETSPDLLDLIQNMSWSFLLSDGSQCFVTSDNPVFLGIVKNIVELSLPLSKEVGFVASWTKTKSLYWRAGIGKIKEMNRRSILRSVDEVYSPRKYGWIPKVRENTFQTFKPLVT